MTEEANPNVITLPRVTPEEAKKIWDGMAIPTIAGVSLHFTSLGRPISEQSVSRWKKGGWISSGKPSNKFDHVMRAISIAAPAALGAAPSGARVMVEDFNSMKIRGSKGFRRSLTALTYDEINKESNRLLRETAMVLMEEMQRQSTRLISEAPKEAGDLQKALSYALEIAQKNDRARGDGTGDGAKVIEPDKATQIFSEEEPDPLDVACLPWAKKVDPQ